MSSIIRGSDDFDSAEIIGQNQTWQDVTGSRATGVTYTNTSGKPIVAIITMFGASGSGTDFTIDSVVVAVVKQDVQAAYRSATTLIVPNGSTYNVSAAGQGMQTWSELR